MVTYQIIKLFLNIFAPLLVFHTMLTIQKHNHQQWQNKFKKLRNDQKQQQGSNNIKIETWHDLNDVS